MKKVYFVFLVTLLISLALIANNYKKIEKAENDMEKLNQGIENIRVSIENYDLVKDLQKQFVEISEKFVEYHTSGNASKLKELVSDDIEIITRDNKIYGKIKEYGDSFDWLLFDGESEEKYSHMEIQGYGYLDEKEVVLVHVREYYYYEDGRDVTPPTFLNLFLRSEDGVWIISGFEFDV